MIKWNIMNKLYKLQSWTKINDYSSGPYALNHGLQIHRLGAAPWAVPFPPVRSQWPCSPPAHQKVYFLLWILEQLSWSQYQMWNHLSGYSVMIYLLISAMPPFNCHLNSWGNLLRTQCWRLRSTEVSSTVVQVRAGSGPSSARYGWPWHIILI